MRTFLISLIFVFSLTSQTCLATNQASHFEINGWREVVASVSDLDQHIRFFKEIAGWTASDAEPVAEELLLAWNLNPQDAPAKQILVSNPGTSTGFIRLIQLNRSLKQIRPNSQPWDTGGLYDINFRVSDMWSSFDEMQRLGWRGPSDPVKFNFGPFEVIEWISDGPDGVSFAMIERLSPPLTGWPNLRRFSRTFNSTQIVKDMEPAKHFYMNILGFKSYLEHRGTSSGDGKNVLGLPLSVAKTISRDVLILHPKGLNEGSVELLSFEGLEGRDLSKNANAPNLGLLSLRFPVSGLKNLHKHLIAHDVPIVVDPIETNLQPYGPCILFTVAAPDGAWLTFFEQKNVKEEPS